jgi:hypothetical protein
MQQTIALIFLLSIFFYMGHVKGRSKVVTREKEHLDIIEMQAHDIEFYCKKIRDAKAENAKLMEKCYEASHGDFCRYCTLDCLHAIKEANK